jgi:hypothetical protein
MVQKVNWPFAADGVEWYWKENMPRERYFLYIDGSQRGPYTVDQIDHMVNKGIVSSESMFWCEGLDQWQPVSQLIVPKVEVVRRRIRISTRLVGVVLLGMVLLGVTWPLLSEGWREQHQVELTQEAAYWRARGVLRDTFGKFTSILLEPFDPANVRLHGGQQASVELSAQTKRLGGAPMQGRWLVELEYDQRLKEWRPILSPNEQANPKGQGELAPPRPQAADLPSGTR